MARFAVRVGLLAAVTSAVTMFAPAPAAHARRTLQPPATAYRYAGNVYDRFFSAQSRPRFVRTVPSARRDPRLSTLATAPYAITDLTPIAANVISYEFSPSSGIGYPTAVDNAGRIPYYDKCGCAGDDNDIAMEINDSGTYSVILYEDDNLQGAGIAIPYGVSAKGNISGELILDFDGDLYEEVTAWYEPGGGGYTSGSVDATYGLGINDAGVSVGNDTGVKGSFAAMFSVNARGAVARTPLLPPKNTSWIGVATGINDAGEIVGYATLPGGSGLTRAMRFYLNKNALVIPVAAADISAAAQAINAHGDIVGSAGSQAFLYRYNHVTYLPRPPGDEAGNAVAYAVNASDEAVGDIVTSTTSSTAFLYDRGRAYDLGALLPANSGWQIVHAAGINDAGQIVGEGYFAGEGGQLVGFSMKPVRSP